MENEMPRSREEIEKAYPEAYDLARRFHEIYEENAPFFGYITREETRKFDPNSQNARLMAYVCHSFFETLKETLLKNLPKVITPTVEPPQNKLSQNQIFAGGQMNMLLRIEEVINKIK